MFFLFVKFIVNQIEIQCDCECERSTVQDHVHVQTIMMIIMLTHGVIINYFD